jgi:RNA polymerase sigma-70 factor (ECF subfamily)
VRFETTQWSVVLAVGGDDSSASRRALATLCETYWYPLYAYIRRRDYTPEDAQDLTQSFFASLLERRDFDDVTRERGRFRSFLLASLQHFLANDSDRRRALKRGGGQTVLSLSLEDAEGRYRFEPAGPLTPETIFDRRWALTVIERVLDELRAEAREAGRAEEFERLKASLLGQAPSGGYAAIAGGLGTTEGAVKVAVHRLRRRFHETLRRHIAETVQSGQDVDDEIRYLIRAVAV